MSTPKTKGPLIGTGPVPPVNVVEAWNNSPDQGHAPAPGESSVRRHAATGTKPAKTFAYSGKGMC